VHDTGPTTHPDLLVGIEGADDGAVFRLDEDRAIVQTVDFFTPIVDEAEDWGRIAAANALSDVYAMGGTPLTALQLIGWPRDDLPFELLGEVIRGGSAVLDEAGCLLIGGHSIDDQEPKYGFAVTGMAHPDDIMTNAAAEPGDTLVLTKPIGTGAISTAIKRGACPSDVRDAAVDLMTHLNDAAARAARRVRVQAATDVTGFGLLGHLGEIVRASGVSAVVDAAAVPIIEGARDLASAGFVPGGTERNRKAIERATDFGTTDQPTRILLSDAQTSGGLLLCAPQGMTAALLQALEEEGEPAWAIGEITERSFEDGPTGKITVR